MGADKITNGFNFSIGDECTLNAFGTHRTDRRIEHVTAAEQFLRTDGIENGSGVHLRRNRAGDPRRHVGLDQTCDHVNRRTLRTEDQMDSARASFLQQTADRSFHLVARLQHQVGKFVDDDDDIRHEGLVGVVLGQFVVTFQRPRADFLNEFKTGFHFVHGGLERAGRVVCGSDDRCKQMRNGFVRRKFNLFRVDQDQFHFIGLRFVEQTHNGTVDANRFSHFRCTANQQVRHFGNVKDHGFVHDVCAERNGQFGFALFEFFAFQEVAQIDDVSCFFRVRDFYTNRAFPGDLCHTNIGNGKRQSNIARKVHNGTGVYAGGRCDLIARDRRTAGIVDVFDIDAEIFQGRCKLLHIALDLLAILFADGRTEFQHIRRRKAVGFRRFRRRAFRNIRNALNNGRFRRGRLLRRLTYYGFCRGSGNGIARRMVSVDRGRFGRQRLMFGV